VRTDGTVVEGTESTKPEDQRGFVPPGDGDVVPPPAPLRDSSEVSEGVEAPKPPKDHKKHKPK
jgi:hypothetical protein